MVLTAEQRKTKARGAHHKGKGFQRKIAKILSVWYYCGNNSLLKSTPRSGGYRNKLVGDIVNLENPDDFPIHVECKAVEGGGAKWNFQQLLQPTSIIEQWWVKTCDDAKITKNFPMLIFTRNYEKNYVMVPIHFMNYATQYPYSQKFDLRYFVFNGSMAERLICSGLFILENFLEAFSKDDFLEIWQDLKRRYNYE